MAREKEDFRATIEQLNRLFPEKEMLTISEAMQVLDCRSPNTLRKYVPVVMGKVNKSSLARAMCG